MYSEFTIILQLILLTHVQVAAGSAGSGGFWTVRCHEEQVCALRESEVLLSCSYSHSDIQSVMWFRPKQRDKWRSADLPEDLGLDPDYTGRVEHLQTNNSTSHLIIRDLRNTDSGEYRLMGVTLNGERYISNTAVNLTITDIEVKRTHDEQTVNLTCYTSCKLKLFWSIWYKNGQRVGVTSYKNAEPLVVSSAKAGSYFCSVTVKSSIVYSPAVCVWGRNCFSVTYADRRICGLEGSSVNIPCSYSYPSDHTLNNTNWFLGKSDVRKLEGFAGRVEHTGSENRNCTLTLTDLRLSDSGNYRFAFITNEASEVFIGSPGVQLSVASAKGGDGGNWWANPAVWGAVGGMSALLLILLSSVLYKRRRKRGGEAGTCTLNRPPSEDETYTALNAVPTPSHYHTLRASAPTVNIYTTLTPESSSDTGVYTELQKRPPEEEYETLHRKHPAQTPFKTSTGLH